MCVNDKQYMCHLIHMTSFAYMHDVRIKCSTDPPLLTRLQIPAASMDSSVSFCLFKTGC